MYFVDISKFKCKFRKNFGLIMAMHFPHCNLDPLCFFPPKKDLEQNRVYHEVTWSLNQNRPLSQRGVELRH